jgi:hypothetical protein
VGLHGPDFGRWYPLAEAGERAPAVAGVLQVRVAHGTLLDYPGGKSAMIHYAAADDLRAAAVALAAAHPDVDWLCRHTEGAVEDPTAMLDGLVQMFVRRFGTPPRWPSPGRSM